MKNELKIISEIGINYNGDFRLIEELIRQSALGGADFAKFQLYNSKRVFGDDSRSKNEFTFEQVKTIKNICNSYNIEFFASVFDEEKLDWCLQLEVKHLKIASRTVIKEKELSNLIIRTGIKTFVSLGQWKEENPDYNSNPKKNLEYIKLVKNLVGGSSDQEQNLNTRKIIKNIIKNSQLDKEEALILMNDFFKTTRNK